PTAPASDVARSKNSAGPTDCHTEVDKRLGGSDAMPKYEWKLIEGTEIVLSDWGVVTRLRGDMVGRAVCRYGAKGYELSTTAVIHDDKCLEYYTSTESSSGSLHVSRYPATTPAREQVGGDVTGTLLDYYTKH